MQTQRVEKKFHEEFLRNSAIKRTVQGVITIWTHVDDLKISS
jgi:hypothetical protein